jgi:ribose/xylose/arabinose/galactoside ABC-type transport system permease subunit
MATITSSDAETPTPQDTHGQRLLRIIRLNSTLIAFVLLWAGLSIASPYFLTVENVLNILLQSANIGIMAAGMTLVIVAAEIDLSVGALEALAGSTAAVIIVNLGMPAGIGILGGLLIGMLAAMISGFFTARFHIPSFVTTLGMLGIARGFALIMTNGRAVYGLPEVFKFIGQGKVWIIPTPVILAAIIFIIAHIIMRYTRFGTNIYAVGSNVQAAILSGIDPARIRLAVLTISGFCSAIGGLILASRLNSGNGTVGAADNLDVIAAVVIGGTSLFGGVGTIFGTLVGVLLVGSIRNGLNLLAVSAFWQQVAIGALILVAVFIDYVTKLDHR